MDKPYFLKEMLFNKIPNGKKENERKKESHGFYGFPKDPMIPWSPADDK